MPKWWYMVPLYMRKEPIWRYEMWCDVDLIYMHIFVYIYIERERERLYRACILIIVRLFIFYLFVYLYERSYVSKICFRGAKRNQMESSQSPHVIQCHTPQPSSAYHRFSWYWYTTRWWFHILFIFNPTWGRFPIWLIFFRWVDATN